ncbi:hypothetical protein [Variovorax boronicumulans]|uniref:hypothetical protein n=1 Tax=Variovorax boronicumulans TaxID=436515 RepID=UPI0033964C5E
MPNIADLRALLFDELEALKGNPTDADIDRIRLKCALADRVIDITRLEVQLSAIMKGSLDVPFIETQAAERSNSNLAQRGLPPRSEDDAEAPPSAPLSAMERAARVLTGGPKADHRWRTTIKRDR